MDVTTETVGATLFALRSEKKLSRRALVEQHLGKPWSSGRIGDLEKGKHPWSYFRPQERALLLDWLEKEGVGVAALSADPTTPTERTGETTSEPRVLTEGRVLGVSVDTQPGPAGGHVVFGPDDGPVGVLLGDGDEPHLLELLEYHEQVPERQPVDATAVAMAVEAVQVRLGGKPAPFPWPTHYSLDAAPPSDLERVLAWCDRVHSWLDDVDTGRPEFQPANGGPATPVAATVAPTDPGATVTQFPATPTGPPSSSEAESSPQASATPDAVGVAALSLAGVRRVTNSELQTFKHCRRRWWLSWYRGLRLLAEPPGGPKGIGTWVHEALAQWYVPEGQTPRDPRLAYNELVSAAELELLTATAHLPDTDVATKVADFQKDADMGRAMVEGYVEWLAETGADVGLTVVAPEQVLSTLLECSAKLTVQVQGRLDVRLRRDSDLVQLFMDHKTVGNFTDPARRLPMDEQMKTYLLLEQAQSEGAGYVDGALYNLLRRVKRTGQAKPPFFDRLEVRHNPTTVATFRERLRGQALTIDLVEQSLNQGVDHHLIAYPSPSARCTWGCEFSTVCPMFDDGSRAEDFLQEHYVVVNPLDRYDHEETTT